MELHEQNLETLYNMGFLDLEENRNVLRIANNDLNEAVTILTSEYPVQSDVEMKDITATSVTPLAAPPPYSSVGAVKGCSPRPDMGPHLFPTTNLYELEQRVFVDQWSIPYKKDESLAKCLIAATSLAREGNCENNSDCVRFMESCMPESFRKLLTTLAVRNWSPDVQEGVYNMLLLLVDLVVERLGYDPVPENLLLHVLCMAFDAENEFHSKNKNRQSSLEQPLIVYAKTECSLDPYGWLLDIINKFGSRGGFDKIEAKFKNGLTANEMAALLSPLAKCAQFLNSETACSILAPCMARATDYIRSLSDEDLKNKNIGSITDLLKAVKTLCVYLWPSEIVNTSSLCLDVILRMLKCSHFNARMNGLKELIKLIEDCASTNSSRAAIDAEQLLDWLTENRVLSLTLESNIDQVQYMDKIKGIIEFIGPRLSLDELTKIWDMQDKQNCQVIDNIHGIVAAASTKFSTQQFDHLILLIGKAWRNGTDAAWKRLLTFIGKLGKESSQGKTSTKLLDLLWELSHSSLLSKAHAEQVVEEFFNILTELTNRDSVRRQYVSRCVEDIKKGVWVLPALKLLKSISGSNSKVTYYKQDKSIFNELNRNHDVVKLVTNSLSHCHKEAVKRVQGKLLLPKVLVDAVYTHQEHVMTHLDFLQFLLKEGSQYLPWSRAKEIWETLVANPDACESDREMCFDWFEKCLPDLEAETQSQLFQQKLLRMDPSQVTSTAFSCFKTYFEQVNKHEGKLKKPGSFTVVEKLDLTGMDFLWQISLAAPQEEIAELAIDFILELSYKFLSPRLKKDVVSLHHRVINECYNRLKVVAMTMGDRAMTTALSNATKTLTAMAVSEPVTLSLPNRSNRTQNICRLLHLAERYISSIEEQHSAQRVILPHGASFYSFPITLRVVSESLKDEVKIRCHSNASVGSMKKKVAQLFKQTPGNLQISVNDTQLPWSDDQKLLSQLKLTDDQIIHVKVTGSGIVKPSQIEECTVVPPPSAQASSTSTVASAAATASPSAGQQPFYIEQEKLLPGVVISSGGSVFKMLYHLASTDDLKIAQQVQTLLDLIPPDPAVIDSLEQACSKASAPPTPPEAPGKLLGSPRKNRPSVAQEKPEGPHETLRKLLDPSSRDLTPFRLLYNLQILSAKLMPANQDVSSNLFCENFLKVGGLSHILKVLHRDSFHPDMDYNVRQGCYFTALQIARFLICGQNAPQTQQNALPTCSPVKPTTPKKVQVDLALPSTTVLPAVNVIKTMNLESLEETIDCILRVAWAAAAGRLQLASFSLPSKEGNHFSSTGHRSRQSSTGSGTSSGSDGEISPGLHGGVCVGQNAIDRRDVLLAQEALGFLFLCLERRDDALEHFQSLACVRDFVLDVLLGSSSSDVRVTARDGLHRLSRMSVTFRPFLLQLLLRAHLPLWVSSCCTRGCNQRLLGQCVEYFDLACRLLTDSKDDRQGLFVDVSQMLEDEIAWLHSFSPSENLRDQETDSTLMTGHFKFIRTLIFCNEDRKDEVGKSLVESLLESYLFPASHLVERGVKHGPFENFKPKCSLTESRIAAFDILVELAKCSPNNLEMIVKWLVEKHHRLKSELVKEFEYEPLIAGRAPSGYVGLKNAGATCYMNSVLQQLFMQPGLQEALLSIDSDKVEEESLLYQLQTVFGHLLESQLAYHVPEAFWRCFRLWGEPVNVREQQDASEFFNHLLDQVDEYLQKIGWDPLFKPFYEGLFSDQKICQGCPHKYEQEETFLALNLPVKSQSLKESLDQFVKGELLEGDNAYLCEKCGEKRNTVKRTCIKKLPPVLVIQLKRFGFDWEANRAVKFDYHFKFPWSLDMSPYTYQGVVEKEQRGSAGDMPDEVFRRPAPAHYDLSGVVVHSGQASAGHYYSFIKERRSDPQYTAKRGTWYKFNDTTVEEFDLNDTSIETECFGGTYKAKVSDSASCYPETRQRHWNAYLLFYERQEDSRTPRTPHKNMRRFSFRKEGKEPSAKSAVRRTPSAGAKHRDSLSQLTQLVDHSERQGWFPPCMPPHIEQLVREENLLFMRNRDVYNPCYFDFIATLASVNLECTSHPKYDIMMVQSVTLMVNFFMSTYIKYKRKEHNAVTEWIECIGTIIRRSPAAAAWLLKYFADAGPGLAKLYLLECPTKEVRHTFADILEKTLVLCYQLEDPQTQHDMNCVLGNLVNLLDQDVANNCWHSYQYFSLLNNYSQLGTKACKHLFKLEAFKKLLVFLVGPLDSSTTAAENLPRRWNQPQVHDFDQLHGILVNLILSCDLSRLHTCEAPLAMAQKLTLAPSLLEMPGEVEEALSGPFAPVYIREVVCACRETSGSVDALVNLLVQCSFCSKPFTYMVIRLVMEQYASVPSNELKNLSGLLLELLKLDDPIQYMRLQLVIDGPQEEKPEFLGILAIVKANQENDSRRSYQGVKFLVSMAHKYPHAKDYLLQVPRTWQWSVNWLKSTMSAEYSNQWSNTTSNEDSNTKTFQRTVSAQDTLAEATALLTELSSPEAGDYGMETDQDDPSMDEDSQLQRSRLGSDYLDCGQTQKE
ncbi:ubiquitin carboxyl-terminal hydrolase 24-like isoform X2 [Ornithodoros turicata]|uniref:ubiquitin carboxyl-terminal hydrolase 24-like isoform X2 n=1 Tax=Ornithodoros turicata TaxID=34597 RepID=UPI003139BC99